MSSLALGLNPCCNGIYLIITHPPLRKSVYSLCLNPCCNGIYLIIKVRLVDKEGNLVKVLILVVMEYT